MQLLVIAILSILLAFTGSPVPWRMRDPALIPTMAALAALLPGLVAWIVNRRAVRLIDQHINEPHHGQAALASGTLVLTVLIAALHGGLLMATDWMALCRQTPVVGQWLLAPGLIAATPFLITLLLVWVALYPAERAIRQIALEVYLFRGRPARPAFTLLRYLTNNFRHQVLFVLAPMTLILLLRDIVELRHAQLAEVHRFLPDMTLGAGALGVALLAPLILRVVWSTRSLPAGPLRDRLMQLARRLNVRFLDILVWRSGGTVVNAAVVGVFSPLRYLMITDAMLEQMDDTRIEAVFGHEAGHVKRQHILFILLLALTSGSLLTVASARLEQADPVTMQVAMVILGALLLLKWWLLFAWISHDFERQADVYGARVLAFNGLPCDRDCLVHAAAPARLQPVTEQAPLCSSAAQVFGDTLHDVAALNGIPPESHSWRHPSIASRVRFLHRLAFEPAAAARFFRRVERVKAAIALACLGAVVWAVVDLQLWILPQALWRWISSGG